MQTQLTPEEHQIRANVQLFQDAPIATRSWDITNDLLDAAEDEKIDSSEAHHLITQLSGSAHTLNFRRWLKNNADIDIHDYLDNPELVENIHDEERYIKHVFISALAHKYEYNTDRLDEVIELANYLTPEFGIYLLQLCLELKRDHFQENAPKNETFYKISHDIFKFIF